MKSELSLGDLIYLETSDINLVGFYRGISIYKNKYEPIDELLSDDEQFGFISMDIIYRGGYITDHPTALMSVTKIQKISKEELSEYHFICKAQVLEWFNQVNLYTCLTHESKAIREYARRQLTSLCY